METVSVPLAKDPTFVTERFVPQNEFLKSKQQKTPGVVMRELLQRILHRRRAGSFEFSEEFGKLVIKITFSYAPALIKDSFGKLFT